ncbi:ABC transporter ATP-binding protein [Sinirhodobacter huangdaonensis]|uniref:ABC transporter ATP-binding protein n=1 Tax=Paenirhodobacter huangdaonensis TaxID=2501515 RepID=A0A3S3LT70_9RHOB|nr:dipeptide ABC transporter ATP-binding protein [Sinirhodobacter huangdaonensis]RWR51694.1 ABC transporter ATP-binding protein [Sinirhodobacter huangdaonensis]
MSLLEIDGLGVSIGTTEVLRDVSLQLQAGEILGLVGESGSGKSMTALAVIGLLPEGAHSTGSVRLAGREITTLAERDLCRLRGAGVGMIFQEPMTALNPLMTIGDQVAETLIVHRGLARAEARRIARDRLDRVGLPAPRFPLTLFPHELSGGQRQRVAIALAIALRPQLLIADEPTTALDVTTQAEVLELLRDLVRAEGMALLLITHDLAVTAQMAARVAVMQGGRIVEDGPTEALFRAPARPYTRALLAAARLAPRANEYLGQEKAAGAFSWQKYSKPDADALLRVEDARRSYRLPRPAFFAPAAELHAVDGVSFTLRAGESLGLVGESGCGKSTLTRAILGLDPLSGGRITLAGAPVSPRMPPAQRAAVQVVFQDPYGSFDPRQTVARLIAEPFHLTGRPPDAEARIDAALSDVGLSPADRGRYIHEFSGGQRQRLAIARALIIRPRLIVLDEAVSALDVRVRAQVLALLARLQAEHGLSYLFISHDLSVVRAVTSRCLVMQAGRIVEEGPTADLFTAPRHPYTRRLLAATPRLPETWRRLDPAPPTGA